MTAPPPVVEEIAPDEVDDVEAAAHAKAVGARLRVLRHQRGWSLADVEAQSDQEIMASDLAAYEVGEQAVPFFVFRRIVRLYGISSDRLRPVPSTELHRRGESDDDPVPDIERSLIDLPASRQEALHDPVGSPVRAFCVEEVSSRRNYVPVGTAVMVRTRYLGSWAKGFEVAELLDNGYRLRRLSDGSLLRGAVAFEDVQRLSADP